METLTRSNLGQQGINKSTKPTFNGQQDKNNMDIDDNDWFEDLGDDPPSENRQDQNQGADQLVPTSATGQTAQLQLMGAARQTSGQIRPLGKTLQQEFKKLSAQRVEAQLRAHVEQLCREAVKGFFLEPTIAAEKQPNCREPKTPKELSLWDKLVMERAKTVKDSDPLYSGKSQKALDNFIQQVNNIFLSKPLTYTTK